MQQFFSGMHDYDILVVECGTKTILVDSNLRELRASFLPKAQLLYQSFPKAFRT
jgi:hypothetical protein